MVIKSIYTLFLGILLALFVGVGIDTFYEGPTQPEYPKVLERPYDTSNSTESAEIKKITIEYDSTWRAYEKERKLYDKNVSILSLVGAVVLLIISLSTFKKTLVIADGILVGGVLTLLYSVIRGFNSEDQKYRFLLISVSVVISLVLGYIKFIKHSDVSQKENRTKKK